jgi:asparagine N-glycosylation enzyme membrane subunit Stt3
MDAFSIVVGIVGVLVSIAVLAMVLWAIVEIAKDRVVDPLSRVLWLVLVVCAPIIGTLAWMYLSARGIRTLADVRRRL